MDTTRRAAAGGTITSESTPLLIGPPIASSSSSSSSDEEDGISISTSRDAPPAPPPPPPPTPDRAPPRPSPGTNGSVVVVAIEAESAPTAKPPPAPPPPSWMRALAEVSPFLRPRDRHRAALLACAMGLTLLEKVVAILPPLAIRRAVDAISDFAASSSSSSGIAEEHDDDGHRRRTARTVATSIAFYFLLKTLDTAVSSFQGVCQRSVSLDAERRFASKLFARLQVLGISYHLERHAGEVSRVLSRGGDATSTIIDSLWFGLLPTFFEAAVVGTVFANLGVPSIAYTTLASVALYLAYTVGVTSTRLDQRRKVIEKNEAVGRIETETLVNYETVAIFGRERKAAADYDNVRGEYASARVEMLGLFAWLQLGQQSIRLAGTCVGLWLAGRAAVYGTGGGAGGGEGGGTNNLLSPGSFVVVQLYINQLFEPLSYLGYIFRQVTEAVTDLEKAVGILKSEPSVVEMPDAEEWDVALEERGRRRRRDASGPTCEDGAAAAATSSGDITFDDVTFQYTIKSQTKKLGGGTEVDDATNAGKVGKRRGGRGKGFWRTTTNGGGRRGGGRGLGKRINAVNDEGRNDEEDEVEKIRVGGIRNVSFHIPAGKTAALVGPSGSGKTTIVRLILRMYDPDDGSVMVDGINVKRLLLHSLRSNMGVVAQETVLFHASLRQNIMYGKDDATEDEVWEAVRISALETLVKSLPEGLDTVVGERGMKLSGGERQRVGLARCIIKSPKLILLDEATSALDSGTEREIRRNILTQETAADVCKGRTTLIIAHRLSTAMKADSILVLDKGRLVERGTHEQLLTLGTERSMYARMWRDQMEGDYSEEEG